MGALARIDWGELLRRHWAIALLVGIGFVLRLGAALAFPPALLYFDSWDYLGMTYKQFPVGISPVHPSGYPLVLRVLSFAGREPAVFTAAQHLAGLATGVLVYALALRLGAGRLLAAAAAALILLDAWAIALEQHVLTESLFALTLLASLYLLIAGRGRAALGASGLLLAAAVTMRAAGLFAIPVWLAYLLWRERGLRAAAAPVLALALPLLAYAGAHYAKTGQVGVTAAEGWYLYARVAPIADCRGVEIPAGTRPLCARGPASRAGDPDYYLWEQRSPAHRTYGDFTTGSFERQREVDSVLRRFALAHIRARPARYARSVGEQFLRYFEPGPRGVDSTIAFPRDVATQLLNDNPGYRRRYLPDYVPHVHWPAALLRDYASVFHLRRVVVGLLALATFVALLVALATRGRVRPRGLPEALLLTGAALAIVLGSSATNALWVRYLMPVVPLIACGGAVALRGLWDAARPRAAA